MATTYEGSCFCGDVRITVTGAPAAMGYCHCASCRHWSASPMNGFTLWPKDTVQVTKGADKLATFAKTERSHRQWCTRCGGHVMTSHPHWGLVDVYAAVLQGFRFAAALHVNYAERVIDINDDLPKLRDVPKELGGSGEPAAR